MSKLILASQSPRRRDLLASLGIEFDVIAADIDEKQLQLEPYNQYVSRLSSAKAQLIALRFPERPVLAADTTVVAPSGDILEKPDSREDALRMISLLQGTTHIVATAFSFKWLAKDIAQTEIVETKVKMRSLNQQQMASYVATGEGFDKAGGYGAQGIAAAFVERIEGSYTNVIGLPLAEVVATLAKYNVWDIEKLPVGDIKR